MKTLTETTNVFHVLEGKEHGWRDRLHDCKEEA